MSVAERTRTPPLDEGAELAPGYEVIAHLRRGRDCDVYDAWSEYRDCRCIAKVLRAERRAHAPARRRLRSEGRLLLSLSHPHIVRAYELIERPHPILVLETLEGETVGYMARRLKRRLPSTDLAFLGLHLCSAIQYLHRHRILHLDLKPSNVICDGGQAKVIDLSLARRPGRGRRGVGTPRYMAPEQALGRAVGPASDVWGIGAVLYEAATGTPPLPDGPPQQVNGNGHLPVPPGVGRSRRLPGELAMAIDCCLRLEPGDRLTVSELSRILDRVAMRAVDRGRRSAT
jgi:eukaryotic-like serine/threonine-protein kinase